MLEILALIAVQVLFGINYVVSKQVVASFSPLVWASVRILIAAVLLAGLATVLKKPRPPLEKAFLIPLVGFSLLGTIINQTSFLVGLQYTTATNSALINALIPIFTLIVGTLLGRERVTFLRALGLISAFGGVLAIKRLDQFTLSDQTLIGDLLTALNCLSYAFFLVLSRNFIRKYDAMWTTVGMFAYGTVGIGLISIPSWIAHGLPVMTPELWVKALFAVIGGTLLTYYLNNWALARVQASQVAIFIYLQPVVASLTAWLWFHEVIMMRTVIASLFILLGLILALTPARPVAVLAGVSK